MSARFAVPIPFTGAVIRGEDGGTGNEPGAMSTVVHMSFMSMEKVGVVSHRGVLTGEHTSTAIAYDPTCLALSVALMETAPVLESTVKVGASVDGVTTIFS
jgi:hypothetical protein